jgi:Mrp family chromosome partitioning ATPase/predicted Fe-Mo cluster-binding NifX family protein
MPFNEEQRKQIQAEQEQIKQNIKHIKHQILVLSGKGGVGKSSIAVNLAVWLSMQGKSVGLLDIDIHGPSIPKLLNLEDRGIQAEGDKIKPILYSDTLKIMSIGFLLQNETDALIWRGPMKHNVIKQFVTDVAWGSLDYLIVDCPPGTGDEPLSIVQLLGTADGAVIVTTPQQLAVVDVKKCITFCRQLKLPVLGVLENMSGFVCPKCGENTDILKSGGGEDMASRIPIDPQIVQACDDGKPYVSHYSRGPTADAFKRILTKILEPGNDSQKEPTQTIQQKGEQKMRIAVPLAQGKLSLHFGHCEQFAIIDVDRGSKDILSQELVEPPPHEPGVLPKWLSGLHVELIIAGGMGQRAQQLFTRNNIKVVIGASDQSPEELVSAYLENTLETGDNICDH